MDDPYEKTPEPSKKLEIQLLQEIAKNTRETARVVSIIMLILMINFLLVLFGGCGLV